MPLLFWAFPFIFSSGLTLPGLQNLMGSLPEEGWWKAVEVPLKRGGNL